MAALLETRNMDISFGGVHAVNNVSFDVNEGEILALIGPNGSGKSTCVNLISGAYKLDHGEICFNGKPLTDKVSTYERARMGIYRTFQTPKPFGHMTVFDNVYAAAIQKYPFAEAGSAWTRFCKRCASTISATWSVPRYPLNAGSGSTWRAYLCWNRN